MPEPLAHLASHFTAPGWLWALLLLPLVVLARGRAEATLSPRRRWFGATVRCLAFAMLIVAMAGPVGERSSRLTDIIVLLDVSNSTHRTEQARALDFANTLIARQSREHRIGVVAFAREAAVEASLDTETLELEELTTDLDADGSNLQRALELALSRFGTGGSRRIVLISDGLQTAGSAMAAAAAANGAGVRIDVRPMRTGARHDVLLTAVSAPARIAAREPFAVRIEAHAEQATSGLLTVLRNGELVYETEVKLRAGRNVMQFADEIARAGLFEYEAVVNVKDDRVPENNRYQAFVRVDGRSSIALVAQPGATVPPLAAALTTQGLDVQQLSPAALPGSLHQLADFSLVILQNVSGFDLSLAKLELLERYVSSAGGGVIAIGGERSFSAGGYQDTPLEALLPVTMDIPSEVKIPSLIVSILIDRSGSMSASASGQEKLSIAKNAAFAAIEVLNPLDRLGVLAFDNDAEWIVPLTQAGHRRAIAERLRQLKAGGGTNLLDAMREAHRTMREQQAKLKHMIILSDGLSDDDRGGRAEFDALTRQLAQDRVTVSTVAFGHDANQPLMARLARLGKGRFYFTDDPGNVPRIFTSETVVVSRGLVVERSAQPVVRGTSEVLRGFKPTDIPRLDGYLRVHSKPAAETLLDGPDRDPLLAVWNYGLGRSAAFMSDLDGRWSKAWLSWPEFPRLASQLARWSMRPRSRFGLTPQITWHDDGRGTLTVDALDLDLQFVNGLELAATINGPRGLSSSAQLQQIAPGRYVTRFGTTGAGRYYVNLSATGTRRTDGQPGPSEGISLAPQTHGAALPYSAEYQIRSTDLNLLAGIAQSTGGTVLSGQDADLDVVLATNPAQSAQQDRVWWPLIVAAMVLLIAEVAIRRVQIPAFIAVRLARTGAGDVPPDPEYGELLDRLRIQREAHLSRLADRFGYQDDDPVSRARLYTGKRDR
ncbi:MAG: VWA domain-containing protein [Pseudomonadota bacterium]